MDTLFMRCVWLVHSINGLTVPLQPQQISNSKFSNPNNPTQAPGQIPLPGLATVEMLGDKVSGVRGTVGLLVRLVVMLLCIIGGLCMEVCLGWGRGRRGIVGEECIFCFVFMGVCGWVGSFYRNGHINRATQCFQSPVVSCWFQWLENSCNWY